MERELKLHVPAEVAKTLKKALLKLGAEPLELRARYFDTPQRELTRQRMAIRVRQEGARWVQTLKAAGSDSLSKVEINHDRPDGNLDLSLYKDTPVQEAIAALDSPVQLRYETEVTRWRTELDTGDAIIEIAFDQGVVRAGERSLPISEIEFELMSGDVQALFSTGMDWLEKYDLVIDLRSKSERGDILARSLERNPAPQSSAAGRLFKARSARPAQLLSGSTIHQAYVACSAECLEQVIRNATLVAGVDTEGVSSETRRAYIHQLRVGLRRLRSCWKLFHEWVPEADFETTRSLRKAFSLLGKVRDSDVLHEMILPPLQQAGMPALPWPSGRDDRYEKAQELAASSQFQAALLTLLARTIRWGDEHRGSGGKEFAPRALSRLTTWYHDIITTGSRFDELSVKRQHGLRNQIKTLRYASELCADALQDTNVLDSRGIFAEAQDVLGDLNDFYVAEDEFLHKVKSHPHAWFAIGWLRAMQDKKRQEARELFLAMEESYSPTTAAANSRATKGCKSSSPSPTPIQ